MKIKNSTHYDPAVIRRIVVACHNAIAKHEGRLPQWGRVRFEVTYTRQSRGCSGYAYLRGSRSRLRIPKRPECAKVHDFASLTIHEMFHLYGYNHRAFRRRDDSLTHEVLAALDLPIVALVPLAAKREVVKVDIRVARYERLRKRAELWEGKLRRAQAAVKRIKVKIRRYELTFAKAASKPKGDTA